MNISVCTQFSSASAQNNFCITPFRHAECCDRLVLDLQWFAKDDKETVTLDKTASSVGGDASADDTVSATNAKQATPDQTGEHLSRAAKRQARASGERMQTKNPLSAVQYGKGAMAEQAAADTARTTAQTRGELTQGTNGEEVTSAPVDKKAAFAQMIRGEYKDEFSAYAQNMINQRFKQTKQLEAKTQKAEALMQRLAQRYGVNASDMDAILRAAESDDSYTEKEANTRGLSVDEMRRVKRLESENAQLRSHAQQRSAKDAAHKLYENWVRDGEQLKGIYPEFDLKTEVKNPMFTQLIKSGVPLRKAYETSHLDQILGGAMQYTADKVAKGMAARISDRSNRPAENGTTPHAGAVVKPDVASLSRADREEIERRVMRGEKILF